MPFYWDAEHGWAHRPKGSGHQSETPCIDPEYWDQKEKNELLVEADSHLSAIVHRFGSRLPEDFVKDIRGTADRIRKVTERRSHLGKSGKCQEPGCHCT